MTLTKKNAIVDNGNKCIYVTKKNYFVSLNYVYGDILEILKLFGSIKLVKKPVLLLITQNNAFYSSVLWDTGQKPQNMVCNIFFYDM